MFKNVIATTPLTTDVADSYFQNITGNLYSSDCSFLATLRALVAPRMTDEDGIELRFGNSTYSAADIGNSNAADMIYNICSNYSLASRGQLVIHGFQNREQDSNIANITLVSSKFAECYSGYHKLDKVTEFFRKAFQCVCFVNPDIKSTIIFVEGLDIRKVHYLQCAILAALPWFFDPTVGLSEEELALIYSLREKSSEKYEACIAKFAEKYDFRVVRIRQLLNGFESRYERLECDAVRGSIDNLDRQIASYNERIADFLRQRRDECIRLLGLEQKLAEESGTSDIMEYFINNRRLTLVNVDNNTMDFIASDYLMYFDKDQAKRTIENHRSYVYTCRNGSSITGEQMAKLMTAIFVDEEPKLRIKICAAYRFDLNGNVMGRRGYSYPAEFKNCMPNPHIHYHSCMGGYLTAVNRLLQSREYIGALEQSVASCRSLNWGDSTVMCEFLRDMYKTGSGRMACIELPDGRVVSSKEAIEWLESQEAVKNEQTEEA